MKVREFWWLHAVTALVDKWTDTMPLCPKQWPDNALSIHAWLLNVQLWQRLHSILIWNSPGRGPDRKARMRQRKNHFTQTDSVPICTHMKEIFAAKNRNICGYLNVLKGLRKKLGARFILAHAPPPGTGSSSTSREIDAWASIAAP